MKNKLIIRLSNNLGNQMFMYATAYTFAKKLNRDLFIDNETAYKERNNIHKYDLDIFDISSKISPNKLKFLGPLGYIKRKLYKKLDIINKKKAFYIEPKNNNKQTNFNINAMDSSFKNVLHVEGHFETEKYFKDYINDIKKEFTFKKIKVFENNKILHDIKNSESVAICIRQNRFSERKRPINKKDKENSDIFVDDQIRYIKKSIDIIKSKVTSPKFFLWSNDNKNLVKYFPTHQYTSVFTNEIDLDLFLMSQTKHFIVIPSSFNWWGAWLGRSRNSIVIRPSNNHFSNFRVNNNDFWPNDWMIV